jgi:hypothetical protein
MARLLKFKEETETSPRPYLAVQRELKNTVHNQQQISFQPKPSKVNGETDFFKNMPLFLCYIFYCYFSFRINNYYILIFD